MANWRTPEEEEKLSKEEKKKLKEVPPPCLVFLSRTYCLLQSKVVKSSGKLKTEGINHYKLRENTEIKLVGLENANLGSLEFFTN